MTHMDLPRKVKRTFFRLHGDMEQAEHVENFTQFQKTDKGKKISNTFRLLDSVSRNHRGSPSQKVASWTVTSAFSGENIG